MGASKRLNDQQWQVIEPLLPLPNRMGRPRANDRQTLDAILFVLRSGCRWEDLPHELGSPTTAWRRLKVWEEAGVWENIWRAVLASLEAQDKLEWAQAPGTHWVGTAVSFRLKKGRWSRQNQERQGHQMDAGG